MEEVMELQNEAIVKLRVILKIKMLNTLERREGTIMTYNSAIEDTKEETTKSIGNSLIR